MTPRRDDRGQLITGRTTDEILAEPEQPMVRTRRHWSEGFAISR